MTELQHNSTSQTTSSTAKDLSHARTIKDVNLDRIYDYLLSLIVAFLLAIRFGGKNLFNMNDAKPLDWAYDFCTRKWNQDHVQEEILFWLLLAFIVKIAFEKSRLEAYYKELLYMHDVWGNILLLLSNLVFFVSFYAFVSNLYFVPFDSNTTPLPPDMIRTPGIFNGHNSWWFIAVILGAYFIPDFVYGERLRKKGYFPNRPWAIIPGLTIWVVDTIISIPIYGWLCKESYWLKSYRPRAKNRSFIHVVDGWTALDIINIGALATILGIKGMDNVNVHIFVCAIIAINLLEWVFNNRKYYFDEVELA